MQLLTLLAAAAVAAVVVLPAATEAELIPVRDCRQIWKNARITGNAISQTNTNLIETCRNRCVRDSNCQFITYENNQCTTFRSMKSVRAGPGVSCEVTK